MLLEVVVASFLTIGVVLAITAVVLANLHATTLAEQRIQMADDGLNAIVDLRASTGYNGALLNKLIGERSTSTLTSNGMPETITVNVTSQRALLGSGTAFAVADVKVERDGEVVNQQQTLVQQAPAPGSVVSPTPVPQQ